MHHKPLSIVTNYTSVIYWVFKDNSCVYSRMIPTISAIQVTLNLVILSLVAVWCWYQFKNRHMLTFARKLATLEPTLPILGHILYCLPDLDGKWWCFCSFYLQEIWFPWNDFCLSACSVASTIICINIINTKQEEKVV